MPTTIRTFKIENIAALDLLQRVGERFAETQSSFTPVISTKTAGVIAGIYHSDKGATVSFDYASRQVQLFGTSSSTSEALLDLRAELNINPVEERTYGRQ